MPVWPNMVRPYPPVFFVPPPDRLSNPTPTIHLPNMAKRSSRKSKPASAGAPNVNFNGVWRNELNSDMTLKVVRGKVTGRYRTGVGQPGPTEQFPLVGFAAADQISFTVNFSKYGSLTSWVGQHTIEDGKGVIKTMWLLSKNVADLEEPRQIWGSVLTGYDNFVRQKP